MSRGSHSGCSSFRRAHSDRPESLAVRDDVRVRKKSSESRKAFAPMCRRRHSPAVPVDLGLHAVQVAGVRHRSQESRWKLGFRGEAGADLSVSGQRLALARSILVGAPRLFFRSVSRPSSLVRVVHAVHVCREARERCPSYLSAASAKREESVLFGTDHDRPDFSGRRGRHEIRNRLDRGRD